MHTHFVTFLLTHYRIRFHQLVKANLVEYGIEYKITYSDPIGEAKMKDDAAELSWGCKVPAKEIGFGKFTAIWQGVKRDKADSLIIIGQENKLIFSYIMIIWGKLTGKKVGYFGHGKNFQAKNPNSAAERWKRFWATKVDWWFTYTDSCADLIESYGYPRKKITVFNNSIDLSSIYSEIEILEDEEQEQLRKQLVGGSQNVGVYVGGIYKEKRIQFLIESAKLIKDEVPDFHLIIMGSGVDAPMVQDAASKYDWIHFLGPKFGQEKTKLIKLGKVWLMPGLVGLAVLDSFAYETPMVTTAIDYHSPEFDYLEHEVNGVVVEDKNSTASYATAVQKLLEDETYRLKLVEGGRISRQKYSIEEMARRFADGVKKAIDK